jgi:hypothetical protein
MIAACVTPYRDAYVSYAASPVYPKNVRITKTAIVVLAVDIAPGDKLASVKIAQSSNNMSARNTFPNS